jgi:hypothetical protein
VFTASIIRTMSSAHAGAISRKSVIFNFNRCLRRSQRSERRIFSIL